MHSESHPLAGRTVEVRFKGGHPHIPGEPDELHDYRIEDWWDKLTGGSWMDAEGNPAALIYGMRAGVAGLPVDDNVLYGKVGPFGHLVHVSELLEGASVG
jgi:hypothetical protein